MLESVYLGGGGGERAHSSADHFITQLRVGEILGHINWFPLTSHDQAP